MTLASKLSGGIAPASAPDLTVAQIEALIAAAEQTRADGTSGLALIPEREEVAALAGDVDAMTAAFGDRTRFAATVRMAEIQIKHLRLAHAEAMKRDDDDRITAERGDVLAALERSGAAFAKIEALFRELGVAFDVITEAEIAVTKVNRELAAAGRRDERLPVPQVAAWGERSMAGGQLPLTGVFEKLPGPDHGNPIWKRDTRRSIYGVPPLEIFATRRRALDDAIKQARAALAAIQPDAS